MGHKTPAVRLEKQLRRLEVQFDQISNRSPLSLARHRLVERLDEEGNLISTVAPISDYIRIHGIDSASDISRGVIRSIVRENDGYFVHRQSVEAALLQWDRRSEMAPALKECLYETNAFLTDLAHTFDSVRIFLPSGPHFAFHIDIPKFLQRLHLPLPHPQALHPGLLNAIYLIACVIGGGQMLGFENLFLIQARTHLERALSLVDRLTHFLWGSLIVAGYYHMRYRLLEAHSMISASVMFAMGCGLHQNPYGPQQGPSVYLDPAHHIEGNDPAAIWYAMYQTDVSISCASGFPVSVPVEVGLLNILLINLALVI